jgi:hypothetical protein
MVRYLPFFDIGLGYIGGLHSSMTITQGVKLTYYLSEQFFPHPNVVTCKRLYGIISSERDDPAGFY